MDGWIGWIQSKWEASPSADSHGPITHGVVALARRVVPLPPWERARLRQLLRGEGVASPSADVERQAQFLRRLLAGGDGRDGGLASHSDGSPSTVAGRVCVDSSGTASAGRSGIGNGTVRTAETQREGKSKKRRVA